MHYEAHISISPVRGGFIVRFPTFVEGLEHPVEVQEVTTSVGKAMRIAKDAVNAFSLVKKTADDAEA
jgi:hypothetical protein